MGDKCKMKKWRLEEQNGQINGVQLRIKVAQCVTCEQSVSIQKSVT